MLQLGLGSRLSRASARDTARGQRIACSGRVTGTRSGGVLSGGRRLSAAGRPFQGAAPQGPRTAASAAAKDEETGSKSKQDRSVMLRETAGAPITVLEPAKYYSIKTDDYEFLIAMSNDGFMLDLRASFVVDDLTGISSRAEVDGKVPPGFRCYLEVPWRIEDTGDPIMGKKPSCKIPRYYFIEEEDRETIQITPDQVYLFDVAARTVKTVPIKKGPGWDDDEAFLRFLADGTVVLQSIDSTPTPDQLVREHFDKIAKGTNNAANVDVPAEVIEEEDEEEEIEFDIDVPEVDMS